MPHPNLELLKLTAEKLRPLLPEIVFVGGCATGLLVTDPGAAPVRATYDVDVIAEIGSYADYAIFSERLRALGFQEDTREGAPVCRWTCGSLTLDVMPLDEKILGFSNHWYPDAMQAAVAVTISENLKVRAITAPYFLGTKLEAFHGRGHLDYFASHDLEDLIAVVDGRVIFQAVAASTLTPAHKLLFAIDAHLRDDYGIVNDATDVIIKMSGAKSAWSEVSDILAQRAKSPVKDGDPYYRKYQHEHIADWWIRALENAGREDEILAVCEQEARVSGSYERLVKRLIEKKQYEEAERWAAEGIEKMAAKLPGIASSLEKLLGETAIQRRQWPIAAAHAAFGFFSHPSRDSFQNLIKAAAKAGCEDSIRGIALNFLETGASSLPSPGTASAKSVENAEWPLPMPAYLLPLLGNESRYRSEAAPHFDVLIDMAIADRRQDDVLRWYDAMSAGQTHRGSMSWYGSGGYGDQVAAAVTESHPERSLAIYRQRVDDHLPHASASAYEAVAGYLRKMRPILKALHREVEWDGLLADIRLRYKNRPKFMEILDKLDPRPIVEQRKARR